MEPFNQQEQIMAFRIQGLAPDHFSHLFGLSDGVLREHQVVRYAVDSNPGFPDRITLRDAPVGQSVLLVNYLHLDVASPYRSQHAIFVLEGAQQAFNEIDRVPEVLRTRTLSLRAYDAQGMMLDADLVEGVEVETWIGRFFDNPAVDYLHAHNARPGCFACRIDRH
jgi:hypothetical protein